MWAEEKTDVKNSVGRLIFVVISVLFQAVWFMTLFQRLNEYYTWISLATSIGSIVVVLRVYASRENSAYKILWVMLIMAFPILGLCLYILLGHSFALQAMRKRFEGLSNEFSRTLLQQETVLRELEEKDLAVANQARYIIDYGKYPVYRNTDVEFFGDAADGLEAQKEALSKAESFIFMEYHAIEDSVAFDGIRKILAKKAREGVEVRIFYDDVGSIGFISPEFIKRMEEDGIQCRVFNPLVPFLHVFMNNRDHRKITVIDGKVGFTGGYNLADEYFNITHPYGQWKDTGIRMTGDAVKSLTVMFLEMWNAIKKTDADYGRYLPEGSGESGETGSPQHGKSGEAGLARRCEPGKTGFVQPYGDSPLDDEPVGENVYMNVVKNAKRYVYFTTPYLIISDEFNRELSLAAKRGVDVRIITPGIPDKKTVYKLTRSYYAGLARNGVRIYEYTPGFLHAKQCVCDDETAVIGTINLDYRSLYLHFENGVLLYDCGAVKDMKQDFENMFPVCREVTENYRSGRSAALRIGQCILRLLAPLM